MSMPSSEHLWTSMRVQDVPSHLWQLYFDYLWDPTPDSWVSTIAYMFRLLAIAIVFPFALLTLLDIMSYVIARTLGVVETTRASTNDKRGLEVPGVVIADESSAASEIDDNSRTPTPTPGSTGVGGEVDREDGASARRDHPALRVQAPDMAQASNNAAPTAFFFSPTEENNLELSGANILSPAMSRQGSPSAERNVSGHSLIHGVSDEDATSENPSLLRRRGGAQMDVPHQLD